MKKILLIINFIFLIGIVNVVNAANIGIVVEFNDGSVKTDCVNVPSETDGFQIVEKSIFNILWSPESPFGSLICKIEGEGTEISGNFCEFFSDFWNFNILPDGDNTWIHSPVGHNAPGGCWNRNAFSFGGHYCGIDKDVLGYKFGSGGDEPPLKKYNQVCEKLEVKDIKVYVNGKKEAGADEDGGKIDVIPGSKLELKIKLKNLYTGDEDVEINDITVEGTLEDIDDGSDIEDEANDFDLNPKKDKEVSLEFDIPLEVEDNEYDLIIEIQGENERSFLYSKKIEFEVEVDKEKHDIIFNKLEFLDSSAQCGSSANLKVDAVNLGTNDETVKLVISNEELGIRIQEYFELSQDPFDKDNSFSKTYKIILPSGIATSTYTLRADLFYGDNIESSTAELNIVCGENVLEEKSKDKKSTVSDPKSKTTIESKITGAITATNTEGKKLSGGNVLMMSLVIGEILILIAGVALLIHIIKK